LRQDFQPLALTGLILLSLLVASSPQVGWAAPGQDPQQQTVPTPPPTEVPRTVVPPRPEPARPSLSTPTVFPSASLSLPTATPVLPTPAATPVLTVPGPTATASLPLTLLPAPVEKTPPVSQRCQSVEQMASPLRSSEFELLTSCRILVRVPAGAVMKDTLLRLAPRLLTEAPPAEARLQMRSVVFTLDALSMGGRSLSGFIFARPYTVTIRYNQTDVALSEGRADQLAIAYYNAAARQWTPLHSQVDPKEKLVWAEFDWPGWLALMLVLSPGEGTARSESSQGDAGVDMARGEPAPRPASTSRPLVSETGIAPTAPTSAPWPWNQWEKANSRTRLPVIAGALFLLALAAGLYIAGRERCKS